ncbi:MULTISPECIES: MoaD/ThiS family protein [unclassified Pseudoalteromonas]|uniref:MoaD/ThiS family protein n=1 Tax=unclassified Pseudoalteromonas TaxID=194690 RepID=UPI000CF6B218|nr:MULTISPECIES: MoaD/ThiS family protein [unclassified Pseudoalteromonas]MBS3798027.1 MoaD/ThiS family protein [Pseudoalteromonas sp. BDTF-M6]
MISVLFFGRLRDLLKCERLELHHRDLTCLADVRAALVQREQSWEEFLQSKQTLGAVNQSMADEYTPVNDGDEVAFFPPVTGG